MKDGAILEAISGESEWMESLLVRLVEAPTVLGNEEAGQEIMAEAFRECGFMTGFRRRKPISFSDGLAGANGAISLVQRELPLRTLITECWRLREEGSLVKHLPNKGLSFRVRKPSALSERVKELLGKESHIVHGWEELPRAGVCA